MTLPHFYIFVIISPLKRIWSFIWRNLNFLYPRIICTKFDWIRAAGSVEEDFFKKIAFLLFRCYLPLEKGDLLHWNKLETSLPKDNLCKVWLKLAQWFSRRSRKCKSLQTDGQTDGQRTNGDQNSFNTWAFSSGELKKTIPDIWSRIMQILLDRPIFYKMCPTDFAFSVWQPYIFATWNWPNACTAGWKGILHVVSRNFNSKTSCLLFSILFWTRYVFIIGLNLNFLHVRASL
jgi:hypothetical protein